MKLAHGVFLGWCRQEELCKRSKWGNMVVVVERIERGVWRGCQRRDGMEKSFFLLLLGGGGGGEGKKVYFWGWFDHSVFLLPVCCLQVKCGRA